MRARRSRQPRERRASAAAIDTAAALAAVPLARVRVLGNNPLKNDRRGNFCLMGSFDPLKIGLYVLLLLPGFIFVQVLEFHLLREEKPQFEKTLEIILASAFLWVVAVAVPVVGTLAPMLVCWCSSRFLVQCMPMRPGDQQI